MTRREHDTLAARLARILGRLNDGEALDPAVLAADFGVNLRTIQRDLNERFGYLDLQCMDGKYRLNPARLGRLSTADLHQFAALAGVRGLFPGITNEFLRELFDDRVRSAYLVKGHHYENLYGKDQEFRLIEQAITDRCLVSFDLVKDEGSKGYVDVEPYQLVNHKGIWYLAARHGGRTKTFAFACIERLLVSDQTFEPDPEVLRMVTEDDGIWFAEQRLKILIRVAADVARYFTRRKLIPNQVIEQTLDDGGLLVSTMVSHPNQVLPIVRYWIPHLRILEPAAWQADLMRDLAAYLHD